MSTKQLFVTCCLLLAACIKQKPEGPLKGYDIFLIAGQSNAFNGRYLDLSLDKHDLRILQLGRAGTADYRLLLAIEPLQHHSVTDSAIGFALPFAKLYADTYLEKGRKVLLIPCAENGSGFINGRWNRGNPLYEDAVDRVNYCLRTFPGSNIKGILWHQGEADVSFGPAYHRALDGMIQSMRNEISIPSGRDSIPFITGGLVPYWVENYPRFAIIDSVLRDLPNRITQTGYASPYIPFIIKKANDLADPIHFDAKGQRELGIRYFNEYQKLQR